MESKVEREIVELKLEAAQHRRAGANHAKMAIYARGRKIDCENQVIYIKDVVRVYGESCDVARKEAEIYLNKTEAAVRFWLKKIAEIESGDATSNKEAEQKKEKRDDAAAEDLENRGRETYTETAEEKEAKLQKEIEDGRLRKELADNFTLNPY